VEWWLRVKIVRSICEFQEALPQAPWESLEERRRKCEDLGYSVQTLRLVYPGSVGHLSDIERGASHLLALGVRSLREVDLIFDDFIDQPHVSLAIDGTSLEDMLPVATMVAELAGRAPEKMFEFSMVVNPAASSPYFPGAMYERSGYSIGLQSPSLREEGMSMGAWLSEMNSAWLELEDTFGQERDFIGIDSSVAPLGGGLGSFAEAAIAYKGSFSRAQTSDFFHSVSSWIRERNPRPAGYCGLMFPCLEDEGLSSLYEQGRFGVDTALFLSLHSGVGLDTYPIAMDEPPEILVDTLRLVRALSLKHRKSLSVRFVSDGIARVGHVTQFNNPYLQDVRVRSLISE
jgi:hypothetical protein